ncbi:glycosyltransferase family 2 protein [Rhodopirellula sp. JC740]|uniref:Glycosyltransferase family 2 protein n=1 Tax=Rhodopirellula halodulae TaxID=2894198 RepID=A0ABS8ND58_9BACT|nr:glycosyltransferase family 2 protein [Rhodopirellula sp. JC740]MCC9640867.1 glycosyltransferase family 2 protein [Rhodopirellula sp. JC740]
MSISNTETVPVTVLLAVRNEAANLERCLRALAPAQRVFVIDSGSTDQTVVIAAASGAVVHQFHHEGGYPKKRQWALENLEFPTEWVLMLDADEVVPEQLWVEISRVVQSLEVHSGYLIRKGFHFLGHRMKLGGFSHQAVLLVRAGKARFEQLIEVPGDTLDMEVHERVIVDGPVGVLTTPLIHEDFKGLESYIDKHNRYSTWEAHLRYRLLSTGRYGSESVEPKLFGNAQERRRWLKRLAVRMPGEPLLWFLYHFVFRLGFLEGRPGFIASQIRAQYIANVRAKVFELRQQR